MKIGGGARLFGKIDLTIADYRKALQLSPAQDGLKARGTER
jgi:hypothetical protein